MLTVGDAVPASADVSARFNAAIARAAAGGQQYMQLAAAALGSGAPATELDLLLLDTWLSADGALKPEDLAQGVAKRLQALGRKLQFRGSPISDDQLQSHIAGLVPIFLDMLLPHWRRIGALQ